ncbi:hypothetical protein ACVBE9_00630 [Eionea flava]
MSAKPKRPKALIGGFDLANLQKDFDSPLGKSTAEGTDGNAQSTGFNVSISLGSSRS